MQAYSFEPSTGLYTGPVDVDSSPMEPGVFLLPAFATFVEPPATGANQVAHFNRETQEWGVIDVQPADDAPAVEFHSVDQRNAALKAVVTAHSNTVAVAYGFDDMADAVSYAEEDTVPAYQKLGRALRAWRSVLWNAFDSKLAEINAGVAPVPTAEELVALLPAFEPPQE